MQGRRALLRLSMVAVLIGVGIPGMVREVAAGIPISSCGPIMQSGSYELTQGLAANGDCLVVQAEFVTIDLKGFAISGMSGWGTAIVGGWGRGLTVRDGMIYNFNTGIRASEGAVVERVRLVSNDIGVEAAGPGPAGAVLVKDSVFEHNRMWGVWMSSGTVTGSIFRGNSGAISATSGGTIVNNTLTQNSIGIETQGPGASIQGNTVTGSWNHGVNVTCPANIIGNTVTGGWTPFVVQGPVWECNFEHNLVSKNP
jgi:hypothetical protein